MQVVRQVLEEVGRNQRDHAEANRYRDHEQIVAVVLEVDRGEDARAGGRHHAEHHEAGAAEHHQRHGLDQRRHLGHKPEQQQDAAAGDRDPARAHAGDADQADILRERRIGKGVEQPAQECADAVGPQAEGQRVAADRLAGDLAERQKHAEGFDHHHDHHDAHGDDGDELKFRHPEMQRQHDRGPWRCGDLLEMHDAKDCRKDGARDDAEQHCDIGDEAGAPFDQTEDHQQHEQRNAEPL